MVDPAELRAARAVISAAKTERQKGHTPQALSDLVSAPYTTSDGRERVNVLLPALAYKWMRKRAAAYDMSTYAFIVKYLVWILGHIEELNSLSTTKKWVKYGVPASAATAVPAKYRH